MDVAAADKAAVSSRRRRPEQFSDGLDTAVYRHHRYADPFHRKSEQPLPQPAQDVPVHPACAGLGQLDDCGGVALHMDYPAAGPPAKRRERRTRRQAGRAGADRRAGRVCRSGQRLQPNEFAAARPLSESGAGSRRQNPRFGRQKLHPRNTVCLQRPVEPLAKRGGGGGGLSR